MPKSILVYFKSENDAEAARAKLQSLRVADVYVDHIPEGDDHGLYVPANMGYSPDAIESRIMAPQGTIGGLFGKEKEKEKMTYLVQAKVLESDYEAVIDMLAKGNGFLKK